MTQLKERIFKSFQHHEDFERTDYEINSNYIGYKPFEILFENLIKRGIEF